MDNGVIDDGILTCDVDCVKFSWCSDIYDENINKFIRCRPYKETKKLANVITEKVLNSDKYKNNHIKCKIKHSLSTWGFSKTIDIVLPKGEIDVEFYNRYKIITNNFKIIN